MIVLSISGLKKHHEEKTFLIFVNMDLAEGYRVYCGFHEWKHLFIAELLVWYSLVCTQSISYLFQLPSYQDIQIQSLATLLVMNICCLNWL